jgi:hypothetical protein
VVTVAATDASGSEPGADKIVFTLSRSANLSGALTVNLAWDGTAAASDYAGRATTITLADGVASGTITITPIDDALVELTETVTLSIAAGVGYTIGTAASASASILDNDKPTASIQSAASMTEGNTGSSTVTLTATLSAPTSSTVTVRYSTANGTATAGSDYAAKAGTLTFAAGVTSQTLTVTVYGDRTKESNETFTVTLSGAVNATLGTASSTVTIVNDDGSPLLAAASAPAGSVPELTAEQLGTAVADAERVWVAADPSADFSGLSFTLGDLEGQMLGVTGIDAVTIDPTAAGWGWTVAAGAMDLRTVVLHELGHALGVGHDEDGLMAETLAPGVSLGVGDLDVRRPETVQVSASSGDPGVVFATRMITAPRQSPHSVRTTVLRPAALPRPFRAVKARNARVTRVTNGQVTT